MQYEVSVQDCCGANWREVSAEEKDGGYGVACMLAFLNGCQPYLEDLARWLTTEFAEDGSILPADPVKVKEMAA